MAHSPTIIVINQVQTLRRLTASLLKSLDFYNVHEAESVHEALARITRAEGKIVVVLQIAPTWSWTQELQFMQDLRKIDPEETIRVVVTTEMEDEALMRKMSQYGVKHFILQTFQLESYSGMLKNAIENQFSGSSTLHF